MSLPFVGPAYQLASRQASAQRSVNLFLRALETPSKAAHILEAWPGLVLFAALGAEIRGAIEIGSRCFVVAGSSLYELSSAGIATSRGTLSTSTGSVGMAWGTTQLVIVDGANGYVLTLASNVFAAITDPDFPGSDRVAFMDGYFHFVEPGTQIITSSLLEDASSIDALDTVGAESSPDEIVAHIVTNQRLFALGSRVSEIFYTVQSDSSPLARANGETIDVGCIARWSLVKADAGLIWIGRDANGSGMVYHTSGGPPQRVSTTPVEQLLQGSSDLSAAVAFVVQWQGETFYAVNAPGLSQTLVYQLSTNSWFDLCDIDTDGQFMAFRATHHVFAHGLHLVGDADGSVYRMDAETHTFAGDPLVCERTSPNDAVPLRELKTHSMFVLDATTGEAATGEPMVELSWSNNGGATFGNPVLRSAGSLGNRYQRLVWRRLGRARDRVWRVRFSADAPFAIVSGQAT